jgi:hypothetical protein
LIWVVGEMRLRVHKLNGLLEQAVCFGLLIQPIYQCV